MSKPFCKVCFDAGKPESEYTSHWVKSLPDRNGNKKVVCPTLLNTECRYCHKSGHTTKFCPDIKMYEKERKREEMNKNNMAKTGNKIIRIKKVAKFEALMDDSDSEQEEDQPICAPIIQKPELIGWAAIVAKPKEEPKLVPKPMKMVELKKDTSNKVESFKEIWGHKTSVRIAPWANKVESFKKTWADWSEDEDEDEDESEDDIEENYVEGDFW